MAGEEAIVPPVHATKAIPVQPQEIAKATLGGCALTGAKQHDLRELDAQQAAGDSYQYKAAAHESVLVDRGDPDRQLEAIRGNIVQPVKAAETTTALPPSQVPGMSLRAICEYPQQAPRPGTALPGPAAAAAAAATAAAAARPTAPQKPLSSAAPTSRAAAAPAAAGKGGGPAKPSASKAPYEGDLEMEAEEEAEGDGGSGAAGFDEDDDDGDGDGSGSDFSLDAGCRDDSSDEDYEEEYDNR
ncbi:hypothetical protein Agub_g13070, partial [Astrephomene gubernaculifera]